MITDDTIQRLLTFDAFQEAENATGKDYKADDDTSRLGMGLHILHTQHKRQALAEMGDTHYGMSRDEFLAILADEGFQMVHLHPFNDSRHIETYGIYWHPRDGILVEFDTYTTDRINHASMHYNIEFPATEDGKHADASCWGFISSGHFHTASYDAGKFIWVGNHDIREGFRHNLARLRGAGKFRRQWVEADFMDLGVDRSYRKALEIRHKDDDGEWPVYKAQDRATQAFLETLPLALTDCWLWRSHWLSR